MQPSSVSEAPAKVAGDQTLADSTVSKMTTQSTVAQTTIVNDGTTPTQRGSSKLTISTTTESLLATENPLNVTGIQTLHTTHKSLYSQTYYAAISKTWLQSLCIHFYSNCIPSVVYYDKHKKVYSPQIDCTMVHIK